MIISIIDNSFLFSFMFNIFNFKIRGKENVSNSYSGR